MDAGVGGGADVALGVGDVAPGGAAPGGAAEGGAVPGVALGDGDRDGDEGGGDRAFCKEENQDGAFQNQQHLNTTIP